MTLLVVIMLFVCIGLPLFYSWQVFRLNAPSISVWLLLVAEAGLVVALIALIGRWDMAGYYTRFLVFAVFAMAILASIARHSSRPWRSPDDNWARGRWSRIASTILLLSALGYIVSGLVQPDGSRNVALPLAEGSFMVGQGGGNVVLNQHAGHAQQRFALDITELNSFGFRAAGLAPSALDRYEIFGAVVVSPCDGQVVSARDGLPDLTPPERDRDNPPGNHVIVDCGGFQVELAHLRSGSVKAAAGDRLQAGEEIGQVGNSGNTTEPHLHVHAVDPESRLAVPLTFAGGWPVRNSLLKPAQAQPDG